MQTGYDNYWMYQNSRHEPVQNLSKNDNCIYPVLPDNYKQMQNGGSPSNRFVTHANTVASSQNFQFNSRPHCMWPSSIYSLPFNSSQANNYHSQGYPAQCNNFNYSHQPQPKAGLRSSDVSVFQNNKGNNLKQFTPTLPQNSNFTNTETARIRVKDVYTLNNNSIYNSALDNNLVETHNNKQYEYPLNYSANNCNRISDFEAIPNHPPPPYAQREQQCLTNQQQYHHYTAPLYLQHTQVLEGSHAQSNIINNKQRDGNVKSKGSTKKPSLILELLRSNKNQEETQSRQFITQNDNERVLGELKTTNQFSSKSVDSHISPERTNDTAYHDSSQVSEKLTCDNIHTNDCGFVPITNQNHNQAQADFPCINEVPLRRFSSVQDSRRMQMSENIVNSNTKSFSNSRINNLENNLVKITIPHTGQSTYIRAVDPSSRDRITNLSLPALLSSSEEIFHDKSNKNNAQNYTQNGSHGFSLSENNQVRQGSCIVSPGKNHVYCTPPRSNPNDCNFGTGNSNRAYYSSIMTSPRNEVSSAQRFQKEPYEDPRRQESEKTFPNAENIDSADGRQNNKFIENSHEGESISHNETVLNNLTIKQEKFPSKADNLGIHVDFTVDDSLPEIKTEQDSENLDLRQEPESSENIRPEEESSSSNSDNSSTVAADKDMEDYFVSENIVSKSEMWENAEKCSSVSEIPEKETLEKNKSKKNIAAEKLKKTYGGKNYKSKINRDKLDLLIEFIKKDDEVIEITKSEENAVNVDRIREENKNEREAGFPRSRRKLCKTEIVKNKNNSREMVSLMSHKTSRSENQDSPKATKNEKKYTTEEQETFSEDEKKVHEIRIGVSDEETQMGTNSKPETELKSITSEIEEGLVDEENIVNVMRALQNLKSHFCMSCALASPVDSFWINVVTGELRCSNCFKKVPMRNERNISKLRRLTGDDDNKPELKPFASKEVEKDNETEKNEIYEETSKESKEIMKEETGRFVCESTSNKSSYRNSEERRKADSPKVKVHYDKKEKKPSSPPPGKSISKEQYVSRKSPSSKEDLKQEKSNISVRRNSFEEEERGASGKKDKKHKRDSIHGRKRANSKEDHGFHKVRVSEEESTGNKSSSRESSAEVIYKRHTSESDKSKTHSSKESSGDHKTKHIRSKHSNSLDDSDRKNMPHFKSLSKGKSLDAEETTRKRRKSMDETIPQKIRALGGRSEEVKLAKQYSEKTKMTSFSKAEDSELKTKTSEQSKQFFFDFIHVPRKKDDFSTSKEHSKTVTESSDKTRRSSTSKENLSSPEHSKKETKHEGLTSKNSDREKKSFVGKIPKISHKSSGKDSLEVNKSPSNDEKHQKSKPLKESQRIESEQKISSPPQMFKKSELLEYSHKSKEQRYDVRTEERKKNNEKNTKIGSGCIGRHSEQEQKCDKSQTIRHSKKERALECIFGRRKEDLHMNEFRKVSGETPPSAKLLEKLIEKTKKLSRSFLAES